ncbi:hypothetical protein QIS99_30450 [Streptomyces sp. B-S-A8]|uniref:Uncharacterized protein n=1 Tax=Streptomyces solicavernae TaxID=3043614 RepID=A0ABT6S1B1_9ACTN|nr:hypothetical protein [Streptomyces sp. B-S-A8]MDI3390482.1 hypothetical protein [Streptomyces sp. B-S-A8]
MVDRNVGTPTAVSAAESACAAAETELHRQVIAAELCARRGGRGLHYASIGAERTGPHLVVNDGEVLGQMHTTSPGVLHDWYGNRVESDRELGPYPTARACAAALKSGSGVPTARNDHGYGA